MVELSIFQLFRLYLLPTPLFRICSPEAATMRICNPTFAFYEQRLIKAD